MRMIAAILSVAVCLPSIAEAQQLYGCWRTAESARDYRELCVNRDGRIKIVTLRDGNGGRCESYPVANVRMSGNALSFDVRPGKSNCATRDNRSVDSVRGSFDCQLNRANRIECVTAWQGWKTIRETYFPN